MMVSIQPPSACGLNSKTMPQPEKLQLGEEPPSEAVPYRFPALSAFRAPIGWFPSLVESVKLWITFSIWPEEKVVWENIKISRKIAPRSRELRIEGIAEISLWKSGRRCGPWSCFLRWHGWDVNPVTDCHQAK